MQSLNSNPPQAGFPGPGSAGYDAEPVILEVCRGRTEHPLRPVVSDRFLIGSSSRCDLRLGGDEMPPLHSLIVIDGMDVWIEAIAPHPLLLVNDRPQLSVRLADGDHIRVGPFEFVAHVALPAPAPPSVATAVAGAATVDADESPAGDLSAADLVERIEAATDLVDEFERRQRVGMESLLHTVEQRQNGVVDGSAGALLPMTAAAEEGESRVVAELEAVVGQLGGVVAELERRSGRQWRREAGYLDAVSTLFDTQDRLSGQLDSLLRRVADLNAGQSGRESGRAIA